MRSEGGRSLNGQLIRRLIALQSSILLAVLLGLFLRGDLFSFRSADRTIETLQRAIERDASGALHLRETDELKALRAAEPDLWFIIRDAKGNRLIGGQVPAPFTQVADSLDGVGQARFGSTVDSEAMESPEARMRQVTTSAGEVQILTGTESRASLAIVALGAALVFIKIGLPIALVMILGIVIATPLVVRTAVAGIAKAEKQAALIDIGQRGVRLDTAGTSPEIASLISAINEALRRLDEGYDRYQRFLADAAHELRTPIAILDTRVASLPPIPERAQLAADLTRLTVLTEQLLDLELLRREVKAVAPISIRRLAKRVISDMAPLVFAAGYELDFESEEVDPVVQGDEGALERVLANLIQNAVDHGGRRGTIRIRVCPSGAIEVCDDGPGIPISERDRVFEPFHRLKPRSRGSGLGLHLAQQIVELHGGRIAAGESSTGGARMTVCLPVLAP
ncbi:HAMP domain-containing histidine kinase [Bosea sp. F3-2]|nr:HAMP domain-containing histidine kinase [Bosea sp. F3-2]